MFDPRPLCCSSSTTTVGGTTDTNFVDSAHPTVARIRLSKTSLELSSSRGVFGSRESERKKREKRERREKIKAKPKNKTIYLQKQ